MGVPSRLTGGFDLDESLERRKRGNATSGEKSLTNTALLTNEDNLAKSVNAFIAGTFFLSDRYTLTAGARLGEVSLESAGDLLSDGDGSGRVRYSQFSPVVGLTRHMSPYLNIFVNYGRGFETPTLAEVAYKRVFRDRDEDGKDDDGNDNVFRTDLLAAKNHQAELGLKLRLSERQSVSATLFWVTTEDEIVTDLGGPPTSFKNAPKTQRIGTELSWSQAWSNQWRSLISATVIDAVYDTSYISGSSPNPIPAGNKIPGIPAHVVFAEVEWAQARNARAIPQGWSAGLEVQSVGRRYSDDANTRRLSADPFESVAIRSAYSRTLGSTDLQVFARIDNLLDEKYVGSVIVGNASPFEPSPERNWMLGLKAVTRF
jgi:iron complex outermembrane receptor protein